MTATTTRHTATVLLSALMLLAAAPQSAYAQAPPDLGQMLVSGLKATPGCLGVETAQTSSGKQVIFAWFENKQAVLRWYHSDVHQRVIRMFMPGERPAHTPLSHIADDGMPVLAVASLTMAGAAQIEGVGLPFSQIAIELYRPAPGGIAIGGRFAPAALTVPGLIDVPLAPSDKR